MGENLDASGEPDMAKQMFSNADQFEENAIRREQNAATRAVAAESRSARVEAKVSEAERRELERLDRNLNSVTGRYQVKDEETGKMVPDPTAHVATSTLRDKRYNAYLEENPKMDRVEAYRKATEYAVGAAAGASDPEFKTLGSTGERILASAQKQSNVARQKAAAPSANTPIASSGIINRAQWEPDSLPGVIDLAKHGDVDAISQLADWNMNPSGLSAQQRALVTNAVKRLPTNK
jgi:hypothetical protein